MKQEHSSIQFEGLGTIWYVELLDIKHFPNEIKKLITQEAIKFDAAYSRFKPSSYVGHINEKKELEKPTKELVDMFMFARKMSDASNGVFNISVGGTLQRLGYGDTKTSQNVNHHFWDETSYDYNKIVIPNNAAIDFGGFGKGWLLDKLAVLLEKAGYPYYLINGGGDIVLNSAKPIKLGLEHPTDPNRIIGTTTLQRGSLAVSSTIKRQWKNGRVASHHIIDPFTDDSSDSPVISTYIKGETALITDTLATILLLRPDLKQDLEKKFNVDAILIRKDQLSPTN